MSFKVYQALFDLPPFPGLACRSDPYTSLDLAVFIHRELLAARNFLLEHNGSGKPSMRDGPFFSTSEAPSMRTRPSEGLKPADELPWQQDVSEFLEKALTKLANIEHVRRVRSTLPTELVMATVGL